MTAAIQIPTALNALAMARATIRDPGATDDQICAACETLMLHGDWMDYELAVQVRIAMQHGLPLIAPQSGINAAQMQQDIRAEQRRQRRLLFCLAVIAVVSFSALAWAAPIGRLAEWQHQQERAQ